MRYTGLLLICMMVCRCIDPSSSNKTGTVDDASLVLDLHINNAITNTSPYDFTITPENVSYGTDRDGNENSAVVFNGDDTSYIRIDHDANLDFKEGSFTIRLRIKADDNQMDGAGIIAKGIAAKEQFALDVDNNRYRFWVRSTTEGLYIINSSASPDNQWHTLKAVYDRSVDSMYLYQDSEIIGKRNAPHELLATEEPVSIGARKGSGGAYQYRFAGSLSDIAIYDGSGR